MLYFDPKESHRHLFLDCSVSLEVWLVILDWIDLSSFSLVGVDITNHLLIFDFSLRGKSKINYIILL